ncbi:MAG: hypothetical protein U0871_18395 [Gemmataceae bacterium]
MPLDDLRLSQLATRWTLIAQAQERANPAAARTAQAELLPRYTAVVYRYVLGAVHDPAAAEDLCQEFAYRFVRGDFRHARPDRGRFRDYLRTALVHLVGEYRAKARSERMRVPYDSGLFAAAADPASDPDPDFLACWRRELLNRAWERMEQASDGRPSAYLVLRRKADDPLRTSAQLAEEFTAEFGRPFTAEGVRQLVHRARQRFAEHLRAVIAEGLPTGDPAEVEEELAALGLLVYCG